MEKLTKIEWSDSLSIGNKSVDEDHKELIHIYNDLVDLILFEKDNSEFARVLSRMTDYSLKHFRKEESYMQRFGYPHIDSHKASHREYIYNVAMYNFDLLGTTPPEPRKIAKFLGKWWTSHIQKLDLDYEKYHKEVHSKTIYKHM